MGLKLENKDLVPIPVERRIWGYWTYLSFYSMANVSVSTWSAASSLLSIGLSTKSTMGCIVIGNVIICIIYFLTSGPGFDYHIGYTVSQRVIFGINGSVVGVLVRVFLSIVWYGSTSWIGGLLLGNIFSTFSKNYLNMSNTFPEHVNMSRKDLIGFVCFHLLQLPFYWFKPEKLSFLIHLGCLATFFSFLGLVSWSVKINGGNGTMFTSASSVYTETSSSGYLGWDWVWGILSWYGSILTGISNGSDFSRYSKRRDSSWMGVVLGNMITGTIIPLMGLVTVSALNDKYQESLWLPSSILDKILTDTYTPKARAAVFFCALGMLIEQLACNVVGSGVAGGADMAGLFPKYITIRSGAYITAAVSWCCCPWLFYNSSSTFLTVVTSFSIFLAPLCGILVCEYWVKRERKIKLTDLYRYGGIYQYNSAGVNWQNIVIWVIGFAPGLPGLIASANSNIKVNKGIMQYYYGNSLFGFLIAFFLCYVSGLVFKNHIKEVDDEDVYHTFTDKEVLKI